MSYLFRHLQMGGPPMANIEIIREPGGRVVFLGYSPAISERLSSNWCAVMNEAYHRLVAEWPGDPSGARRASDMDEDTKHALVALGARIDSIEGVFETLNVNDDDVRCRSLELALSSLGELSGAADADTAVQVAKTFEIYLKGDA